MSKDIKFALDEQETVIGFYRTEDYMTVYTSDSTMITKINKLLEAEGTEWEVVRRTGTDIEVRAPKRLLTLRAKKGKANNPNGNAEALKKYWESNVSE